MKIIIIPKSSLNCNDQCQPDDDESARKRLELRDKLLKGKTVKVTSDGLLKTKKDKTEPGIDIPPGKLASFYWYENDPLLFKDEKEVMKEIFPQFSLDSLGDGRLCWYGHLKTDLRPGGALWHLQVIYDHDHPNNKRYGGSVKVYSIDPDLDQLNDELPESIPHLLRDSKKNIYLCTARSEDVKDGKKIVTTAASSIAWAAKWIAVFEMWMSGDVTTKQFKSHTF